ncbi:MAG: Asp-tRNA(Asn)/Glu-tRNA(Gln) amidotransferase GatCAB subunit B, partial [Chloroflexi bacterium]|nr:Asp-tRNA(Asn)/Glu-tRNA(Gln) amidotransferase GatCAB subunit B [Chloroflexota bacterium]
QQTMGWDEKREATFTQRTKEEEDDYRYFPEPDLPPLIVDDEWIAEIRAALPELPAAKFRRFQEQYGLKAYDADVLTAEQPIAEYFEAVVKSTPEIAPKTAANWISGELFGLMNQAGVNITSLQVSPQALGGLLQIIAQGEINHSTAKIVLAEMFAHGGRAEAIISARGLSQISDGGHIARLVAAVLDENPDQVAAYLEGKSTLTNWFFGQVMRAAKGKANPQIVLSELEQQLANSKKDGKR